MTIAGQEYPIFLLFILGGFAIHALISTWKVGFSQCFNEPLPFIAALFATVLSCAPIPGVGLVLACVVWVLVAMRLIDMFRPKRDKR